MGIFSSLHSQAPGRTVSTQPEAEWRFGRPNPICTIPRQSTKSPHNHPKPELLTSESWWSLRAPFCNSHPAKHSQTLTGTNNRQFPQQPHLPLSHLPRLAGPGRGTQGHLGMPAGSQFMANRLSTHAHCRSVREKAATSTGCLRRARETQKDSLVPEFLPHRRCKSFWVPTASGWHLLQL